MLGFFFSKDRVKSFKDASNSDTELFAKFHSNMLDRGNISACSAYETRLYIYGYLQMQDD